MSAGTDLNSKEINAYQIAKKEKILTSMEIVYHYAHRTATMWPSNTYAYVWMDSNQKDRNVFQLVNKEKTLTLKVEIASQIANGTAFSITRPLNASYVPNILFGIPTKVNVFAWEDLKKFMKYAF